MINQEQAHQLFHDLGGEQTDKGYDLRLRSPFFAGPCRLRYVARRKVILLTTYSTWKKEGKEPYTKEVPVFMLKSMVKVKELLEFLK